MNNWKEFLVKMVSRPKNDQKPAGRPEKSNNRVRTPWWKNYDHVTSTLALAVSVAAIAFSRVDFAATAVDEQRQRLNQTMQEIAQVQKEYSALLREYGESKSKDSSEHFQQTSSTLNVRRTLLTQTAADIASQIPNRVTSAEYTILSDMLMQSGEADRALAMTRQAERNAKSPMDQMEVFRARAFIYFSTGRQSPGRSELEKTYQIINSPSFLRSSGSGLRDQRLFELEASWVDFELRVGNCKNASDHVGRAAKLVSRGRQLRPTPDPWVVQIKNFRTRISQCRR